jgi:hypothetical protein
VCGGLRGEDAKEELLSQCFLITGIPCPAKRGEAGFYIMLEQLMRFTQVPAICGAFPSYHGTTLALPYISVPRMV